MGGTSQNPPNVTRTQENEAFRERKLLIFRGEDSRIGGRN